jgi:hypothetical protein
MVFTDSGSLLLLLVLLLALQVSLYMAFSSGRLSLNTPVILDTQEDHGSKPAQANSSQDPILKKKKITKKGWWSGSRCRP